MQGKTPSESKISMYEVVLPNDTNMYGNLMGGRLMYWMDIAAYGVAIKHSNAMCMTVAVEKLNFKHAIKLGDSVHIEAKITRAFNSSMEVYIRTWAESVHRQERYESNEAFFIFVAVNEQHKPIPTPCVIPETELEKKMYEDALLRQQLNLVVNGKLKLSEAPELLHNVRQKLL